MIFLPSDEKSCALTVSTTLAARLMNANIVVDNQKTQNILKILKWFAPAKWIAKVALERGTMEGIGWRAIPPISIVSKPATLGSMMSLAGEFMNSEKTKAIEAGVTAPVLSKNIGDELVYLNQLTDKYLPSKDWALRTSAAARILYGPDKVALPH